MILSRVRTAVAQFKQRGRLEDISEDIISLFMELNEAEDLPEAEDLNDESIRFKAQPGQSPVPQSPEYVREQLGHGQPIEPHTRRRMESAFGESFSDVEIHSNEQAALLSEQMNARAFAVGKHIAFGRDQHQPGTLLGDALLAHELAHVVQQKNINEEDTSSQQEQGVEKDADDSTMGVMERMGY